MVTTKFKYILILSSIALFLSCGDKKIEKENINVSIIQQDTETTIFHGDNTIINDSPNLIEATFIGGEHALVEFIKSNLWIESKAPTTLKHGTVSVGFTVKTNGSLSDIFIVEEIEGGCKECDEEAIRIVKTMPKWQPAYEKLDNNNKSYYDDKQVIEIKF